LQLSPNSLYNLENLISKNTTKSISIYLVLVLFTIAIIASLPIIEIDISSQSRGIVRPEKENVPLTVIANGRIDSINIKNNQLVTKGDTLLVISKKNLVAQQILNDSLRHLSEMKIKSLQNILGDKSDSILDLTIAEDYKRYLTQKKELTSKIQQARVNYNRNKKLYDKNVIARVEYETYLYNLRFAKDALNSFVKQQQAQWQSQKHEIENQIKNLESRQEQLLAESSNYVVTAPISGTLENVIGLQVGSFINASQVVATISPDTNLIVENTVLPSDIGLLKIGQDVKFQLDAFNYNQWGMLSGKIIDIDKNITLQNNAAFFKVRCSIDHKELQLKNGYTTTISKGMTLTSRYHITRRSLYDLLFDKVDDWFNPTVLTTP
jgi:HlyD family secretion protein